MSRNLRWLGWSVPGCLAVLALCATVVSSAEKTGERFTAAAINLDRGAAGNIEIEVNRWSSNADRTRLMDVAVNKGPDKLLEVLQKLPRVGYFRTPDKLGWDLHYAYRTPGEDGGERIVLITDRRIGFWEAVNQPRTIDYPFTFIEMRLNRDGEGEGKMSIATKVIVDKDKNTITLENYGLSPVMLNHIRRERS